jgi:hypothetical protein
VPDALVQNHGPETLGEYFEQRRRIARGHYWLEFAFGYEVATLDRGLLVRAAIDTARAHGGREKLALAAAIGTELAARAAGFWDARVVGGKHRTWRVLPSTKKLAASETNGVAHDDKPHRRLSARPGPTEGLPSRRRDP